MEVPGPGSHNPDPLISRNKPPKFSMGMKLKSLLNKNEDKAPGPGTYHAVETKIDKIRASAFSFGKSLRPSITGKNKESPGPGAYKLPAKFANLPDYAMPSVKSVKFVWK